MPFFAPSAWPSSRAQGAKLPRVESEGTAQKLGPWKIWIEGKSAPGMKGWRNAVGNLIECLRLRKTYQGPLFTGACVKHSGVRFYRIRDFKQYYFNSIPPTSHGRWYREKGPGGENRPPRSPANYIYLSLSLSLYIYIYTYEQINT